MGQFLTVSEKLNLLLDVARANELHQTRCSYLRMVKAQHLHHPEPGECDCWLSEPADPPDLPKNEVRIEAASSREDLHGVRAVHLPTGIAAEAHDPSTLQARSGALRELARLVSVHQSR